MKIIRGKQQEAVKLLIYGPEGIGKTTLASQCPNPVFIDTEGGTRHMDVARTEPPKHWMELTAQVDYFTMHPEELGTLVIDTMDWAERLCIDSFLEEKKIKGIEDIPYGKGYVYVAEKIGLFLNSLETLRMKGVNIVLTAHAQMRKFEQPDELGSYDRWELKLSKKAAPMVKEWADMILFCNYKTMVVNVDGQGTQKGKNKAQGGRRVMYTQHHPCWDAKNRFGLPDELDMDFASIAHIFQNTGPTESRPLSNTEQEPVQEPVKKERKKKAQPAPEPEKAPEPVKETEPDPSPESSVLGLYLSDPANLPDNLKRLMEQDDIGEWEIQQVAYAKGYFPEDTPISEMEKTSPGFIQGWIVAFWPNIKQLVGDLRKYNGVPFN